MNSDVDLSLEYNPVQAGNEDVDEISNIKHKELDAIYDLRAGDEIEIY